MTTTTAAQLQVQVRHLQVGDVALGTSETIVEIQPCYDRTSRKTRNTHRYVALQSNRTDHIRWAEWNASTVIHVSR